MTSPATISLVERDWFDYAGLIASSLASAVGVFGLFVAIGAYKAANRQSRQGRNTFELEILKELSNELERALLEDEFQKEPNSYRPSPIIFNRMILIGEDELPAWFFISEGKTLAEIEKYILDLDFLRDGLAKYRDADDYGQVHIGAYLAAAMNENLHTAMRKRTS